MRMMKNHILLPFSVTVLVTVGLGVASLYTFHHTASQQPPLGVGKSAPAQIGTLPDAQLTGVANTAANQQQPAAANPATSGTMPATSQGAQHALLHMPATNSALQRSVPVFLRATK